MISTFHKLGLHNICLKLYSISLPIRYIHPSCTFNFYDCFLQAKRGFPSPFGPVGPPPPSPALFNLPSFAAALASRSAASLVANKQASEANSAAQVALATAAHKQAKSALINKATQEAQDQAAAESALADEANKAAHAAEKTYARMVEVTKMLAKLASEAQASVSQAWEAMQSTKNVKSGQEAMTFKAQQTANMLARKQARTLNELDSAQDAVLQAKLAASKAAAAASGGLRGPY